MILEVTTTTSWPVAGVRAARSSAAQTSAGTSSPGCTTGMPVSAVRVRRSSQRMDGGALTGSQTGEADARSRALVLAVHVEQHRRERFERDRVGERAGVERARAQV